MKELESNKQLVILEAKDIELLKEKGILGYRAGMVVDKGLFEKAQKTETSNKLNKQQKTQQTN